MTLKSVILDLDGTIIDCAERYYRTFRDLLFQRGIDVPRKDDVVRLRRQTGLSSGELLESYIISKDLRGRGALISEIYERRLAIIEDWKYLKLDRVFRGAKETLKKLRDMNLTLMLTTDRKNRENLMRQLRSKRLKKYFSEILCGGDLPGKGAMLSHITAEYSLRRNEFLLVSDTRGDLEVGRRMGGITVGVLSGLESRNLLLQSKPDYIIKNISYLPRLIEKISHET